MNGWEWFATLLLLIVLTGGGFWCGWIAREGALEVDNRIAGGGLIFYLIRHKETGEYWNDRDCVWTWASDAEVFTEADQARTILKPYEEWVKLTERNLP